MSAYSWPGRENRPFGPSFWWAVAMDERACRIYVAMRKAHRFRNFELTCKLLTKYARLQAAYCYLMTRTRR